MADELYNSIHTGPVIDAAISRAKAGGDIDALLQRKVNKNLLDNGHFYEGALVDQRGGMLLAKNATYYTDTALTANPVTVSEYTTVYNVVEGNGYKSFKLSTASDTQTYYAASENVVRGYTLNKGGQLHVFDRWTLQVGGSGGTVLIGDGYVELISTDSFCNLIQTIDAKPYRGKTICFSALHGATPENMQIRIVVGPNAIGNANALLDERESVDNFIYCIVPDLDDALYIQPQFSMKLTNTRVRIYDAKLELGTEQTLAHQDENGNWVLNEIPNYAEELAKCQRFAEKTDMFYGYTSGNGAIETFVPFATTKRANPTTTLISHIGSENKISLYVNSAWTEIDARVGSGATFPNGFRINLNVGAENANKIYKFSAFSTSDL